MLADDSITLDEYNAHGDGRSAFVLGTEGHGLNASMLAAADHVV